MLRSYYKLIQLISGDLATGILGPFADRSQDDIALLQDFLTSGASEFNPRGIWALGSGFVESNTTVDAAHDAFLANDLACYLRDPSYYALSGSVVRFPDLIPKSVITATNWIFSVENTCHTGSDVLDVNTGVPGATTASQYQNLGGAGPYVSGVYAPSSAGHPYVSLVDGWDIGDMRIRHGYDGLGRLIYTCFIQTNVFGAVCPYIIYPGGGGCRLVDVPPDSIAPPRDFVSLRNNPLVAGVATVAFGLAQADRVEARIYDLAGRRVRVLADREFEAGEHRLVWDGTDDQGRRCAHGVYFTAVRYVRGGFHAERKITILR
jgi:hypothetical protein